LTSAAAVDANRRGCLFVATAAVRAGAPALRLIGQMKPGASPVALAGTEADAGAPEGQSLAAKWRSKPRSLEVPEFALLTETNVWTG
jgi:hypothetical protein